MTLAALVSHQAAARPQDAAFIEGAREIRFADLDLLSLAKTSSRSQVVDLSAPSGHNRGS
jgi:hypothetical protein